MQQAQNASGYVKNDDNNQRPDQQQRKRPLLVVLRLDILLLSFVGLNLVGTFIAFSKSTVEPTERRLQGVSTTRNESVVSNALYNEQDDRKESFRRLQRLLLGTKMDSSTGVAQFDNQTNSATIDHLRLNVDQHHQLPRWSQDIVTNYGSKPVILGLDSCHVYRERVSRQHRRLIAPAGMFHTGTTLLVTLLEDHCHFASAYGLTERTTHQGLHGQVPWGKNNPASFRASGFSALQYWAENREIPRNAILPVITVAHPYHWMSNMCRQPFTANWNVPPAARRLGDPSKAASEQELKPCPYVVRGKHHHPVPVTVRYGNDETVQYESMAHLWNKWNREYYDTRAYPRLMVRYEDLLFHPEQVVKEICSCVGGDYYHLDHEPTEEELNQPDAKRIMMADPRNTVFHYTVAAAENVEETGEIVSLIDAWKRYGKTPSLNSSSDDQMFIQRILDKDMMHAFCYKI